MDNRQVIVISEGEADFRTAVRLGFGEWKFASHYVIETEPKFDEPRVVHRSGEYAVQHPLHPKPTRLFEEKQSRMIFYWHEPEAYIKASALPYEMTPDQVASFAWGWLESVKFVDAPSHDGSNGKGFAVYNETWGHVGESHYGIIAISPQWAWYGK